MFCIECGTRNPENAKFCKKCGARMPQPDLAEQAAAEATTPPEPQVEPEVVEPVDPVQSARDLLLSAFRMREAGKLDEAVAKAKEVVALQPDNVSAHALLSTLFEHKGDLDAAIAEREKVLELAPDSEPDREKLEMLKKGERQAAPRRIIAARSLGRPVLFERKPSPTAIAVAAFLVIVIVGSAAVLWRNRDGSKPAPNQLAQAPSTNTNIPGTFGQTPAQPQGTPNAAQPGQQQPAGAGAQQPGYQQPAEPPRRPSNSAEGMEESRSVPPAPVSIPNNNLLERDTRPARPAVEADPGAFHMPDRTTDQGAGGGTVTPQPPVTPPSNPGHIEIILAPDPTGTARTGSGNSGSSSTRTAKGDGSSMDSRSRRALAQEYQMKGDYARAAAEYKKALEGAGDDSGIVHQKIALCYQRMDQREAAIAHYNDAIQAFQQLKASGRNTDLAEQGIRASQAGIANCK